MKIIGYIFLGIFAVLIFSNIWENAIIPGARSLGQLVHWAMILGFSGFVIWIILDLFTRKDNKYPIQEPTGVPTASEPSKQKEQLQIVIPSPQLKQRIIELGILQVITYPAFLSFKINDSYQLFLISSTGDIFSLSQSESARLKKQEIEKKIREGRLWYKRIHEPSFYNLDVSTYQHTRVAKKEKNKELYYISDPERSYINLNLLEWSAERKHYAFMHREPMLVQEKFQKEKLIYIQSGEEFWEIFYSKQVTFYHVDFYCNVSYYSRKYCCTPGVLDYERLYYMPVSREDINAPQTN